MPSSWHSAKVGYLVAIAATAAAVLVRWALDPWMEDYSPLATLYGAVALAVWIGGYRPAALAAILGYLACDWLLTSPRGQFGFTSTRDLLGLAAYVISCSIIIGLGEAMRVSRKRAERERNQALREAGERLKAEEALKDSEAQHARQRQFLETLLDNAAICVAVLAGPQLRHILVNKAYQALRPDVLMIGRTYREVFPASAESGTEAIMRSVLETGVQREAYGLPVAIPGKPDAAWDHRITALPFEEGQEKTILVITWDVTDRERATRSLQKSEQRLRVAQNAGGVGVWEWDLRSDALYWTPELERIYGLPPGSVRNYEDFRRRIHPDDIVAAESARDNAIAAHRDFTMEFRAVRPDAGIVSLLSRGAAEYDETGAAVRVSGVTLDITQRKRAEQALRESEARFRTMADVSPVIIWVTDAGGGIEFINQAYRTFAGVTDEDVQGQKWQLVVHPEDSDQYVKAFLRCVQEKAPFYARCRIRRADGTWRWIASYGAPRLTAAGEFIGHVGSSPDIDDLITAEQALRSSEALFSSVFSGVNAAITVSDVVDDGKEFRFVTANPSTIGWSGIPLERWIGKRPQDLLPARDAAAVCARYEQAVREGKSIAYEEFLAFPKASMWAFTTVSPLRDAQGRIVRVVASSVDISERKQAEEALQQADRRKDEFIATLAHELRNPLAPIRNAVEVLKARDSATQLNWARSVIERQVVHMARLLDDLLDVSRISRNRVELRISRVTLASVLESALETSRPLIEAGRHELTVDLPRETIWLDTDPVRLAQVFSNLLNNAATYTEKGGRIQVVAARQGSELLASVQDNGIGIVPEMLPRVFDMFRQENPALERSQGGLGIGLSLAKGLVEAMGGRIEVRSDGPGKGSQFTVCLPVADDSASERPHPAEPVAVASLDKRRVLVADDVKDSADSLAMMLKLLGHEVHTAYDGKEAVAAAQSYRPDVAVLDLGMPKLNGYEVCRHIREQEWGKRICLIALSGWGQDEDRRRTEAAGFDHHLVKPVEVAALMRLIGSVQSRLVG
jgi:PAS domain S-box-containing protein